MSVLHQRVVALQGASNFRDLGGYAGAQGMTVRWGRLYRSDHLANLTAADVAEVNRRGLTSALDFRGVQESAAAAYELAGLQRLSLSIEPTVAHRMHDLVQAGRYLDEQLTVGLMEDLYRDIIQQQTGRLRAFFDHLLVVDHPVVFHCTAGKDRTGVAAALLLEALGVSRDMVMQDFLITNDVFRPPATPTLRASPQAQQALWSVRPQYLEAAWKAMDRGHGSSVDYLQGALGLTMVQLIELQGRFLERCADTVG